MLPILYKLSHFVIKSLHFVATVAFLNKTLAFCNKEADVVCNKILSDFMIKKLSHFVIKCYNKPNMIAQPQWSPKITFPCVCYHVHFKPKDPWFFVLLIPSSFQKYLWLDKIPFCSGFLWWPINSKLSDFL